MPGAITGIDRGARPGRQGRRDTSTLDDLAATYGDALLPIALDVTERDADFAAVKQGVLRGARL